MSNPTPSERREPPAPEAQRQPPELPVRLASINLHELAEAIYELMQADLRRERERLGKR